MATPVKGWKTSEFWIQLAIQAVSFLAVTGTLTPASADALTGVISQLGGLAAMLIGGGIYAKQRADVKAMAMANETDLELAKVDAPPVNIASKE